MNVLTDTAAVQNSGARQPLIAFDQVYKIYGHGESEVRALDGVSFQIFPGEFVAVMGPSGSGKSTTMNILGCLDTPTAGHYYFKGQDVGSLSRDGRALLRRHDLGFVFQGFNLLARTTALENLELPLIYRRIEAHERHRLAREALKLVGLDGREDHTPAELSGGQQQRVAIARAIVTKPSLLLADEPTGNLDSARSHEIMELLTRFNREHGLTIVLVTHEDDIAAFANRRIDFRDGKIVRETRKGA
ncbi:MAG: ABC transporter ATP-binding protein [Rhodospirillaceae bacterium]|nr:ABC transporter ATP-binding protein [Rhodospirillaceae bacterium]